MIPSLTSSEVRKERIAICMGCPFLRKGLFLRCRKCGCPIKSKTMFKHEACPVGNWGPEENKST